jgi:RimJ/RimL family protein N-acetyltransferase
VSVTPELPAFIIAQKGKSEGATTNGTIWLRKVEPTDLERLFAMQSDPESNGLAGTIPRSAAAFAAHWHQVWQNPSIAAKAILFEQEVVGTISCFLFAGQANVGYWINRAHWGKGIASRAVELFLLEVPTRPLYASVATNNLASRRILQKFGFVVERVEHAPATDRFVAREVAFLVLKS